MSLAVSLLALSSQARAEDARLRLMHEPIPYTDVADAFDAHDRFDFNVHLDYERMRDRAAIYREQRAADGSVRQQRVGDSELERNVFSLGVDVGLWRDVMAFVRLPLILSDERSLQRGTQGLASALGGSDGNPLFALPLTSPSRAGVDYLALGGAWSVLNQTRASWQPTWVLRLEGRRALGKPLRACRVSMGQNVCGGQTTQDDESVRGGDPGVSAGLSALLLETRFSRRSRHLEPYAGMALLVQWPSTARERFQPDGAGRARPGPESTLTLGTALIPWEDRGSFQRITFDLRLDVTLVARGTSYTPLFDALGTSSDPTLTGRRAGVSFQGLTESEQHLRYGGQLGVELQAARYVRFAAGTSLHWVTQHALSDRAPCTGSASGTSLGDDGRSCVGAQVDPRERGELDAPGRRFFIRDQFLLGIYANATAMF
ncbi:MAG: hypothetical protein ABW352_15495 [Polyangiales bacterium]